MPGESFQASAQLLDAPPYKAPISLKLGFPWPAQADAAFLALQVGPATHQTCGQMHQLRQFDLQLTRRGAGTLSKNIQNQTGPVDDPAVQRALKVEFLSRCQVCLLYTSDAADE